MWNVKLHPKVNKALSSLPEPVQLAFALLLKDLCLYGPVAKDWPHYGKLKGQSRHNIDPAIKKINLS